MDWHWFVPLSADWCTGGRRFCLIALVLSGGWCLQRGKGDTHGNVLSLWTLTAVRNREEERGDGHVLLAAVKEKKNHPKWGTSCWSLQWDSSVPLASLNLSEDILSLQSKELAMYGQLLNSVLQKCAGLWNLHSKEPCCWEEALKMRTGQESVWGWPRHSSSHDCCFRDS